MYIFQCKICIIKSLHKYYNKRINSLKVKRSCTPQFLGKSSRSRESVRLLHIGQRSVLLACARCVFCRASAAACGVGRCRTTCPNTSRSCTNRSGRNTSIRKTSNRRRRRRNTRCIPNIRCNRNSCTLNCCPNRTATSLLQTDQTDSETL